MIRWIVFFGLFGLALTLPDWALAQTSGSGDWVRPATGLMTTLESGLVKIGSAGIGIGIIFLGLVACITARMEWNKFAYVLLGGLFIMAGPAALRALLNATQ